MRKPLNWIEIQKIVEWLHKDLSGLRLQGLARMERPYLRERHFENEWILQWAHKTHKKQQGLLFHLLPPVPFVAVGPVENLKDQSNPRLFAFANLLLKKLKGTSLQKVEMPPEERQIWFWFQISPRKPVLLLVVTLIPNAPNAHLLEFPTGNLPSDLGTGRILGSLKHLSDPSLLVLSRNKRATTSSLDLQPRLFADFQTYSQEFESALGLEFLRKRLDKIQNQSLMTMRAKEKYIQTTQNTLTQTEQESHWQEWADRLKAELHLPQKCSSDEKGQPVLILPPLDTDSEEIQIPWNPRLSPTTQLSLFYKKAKRQKKQILELKSRLKKAQDEWSSLQKTQFQINQLEKTFSETSFDRLLAQLPAIEALENTLKIPKQKSIQTPSPEEKGRRAWPGKAFVSEEGYRIVVGRNREENHELTFRYAHGNDLWMHLQGYPGAHAVIVQRKGKTPSLETLLDAAHLTLHYSRTLFSQKALKGTKILVDYTLRKYVRRIKNSKNVSYQQQKTLVIQADPARLGRLLKDAS